MIKQLKVFLRYQTKYLFVLFLIFVLPLGLFYQFSNYELPKVQYVFLVTLFVSQYFYYSEKDFHRKIKDKILKSLKKELKKNPSLKEVNCRSIQIESHRHISIALIALCIFGLMIVFNKF